MEELFSFFLFLAEVHWLGLVQLSVLLISLPVLGGKTAAYANTTLPHYFF